MTPLEKLTYYQNEIKNLEAEIEKVDKFAATVLNEDYIISFNLELLNKPTTETQEMAVPGLPPGMMNMFGEGGGQRMLILSHPSGQKQMIPIPGMPQQQPVREILDDDFLDYKINTKTLASMLQIMVTSYKNQKKSLERRASNVLSQMLSEVQEKKAKTVKKIARK